MKINYIIEQTKMKLLTIKITALAIILFTLTDVSCDSFFRGIDYNYQPPELKNDGLEVGNAKDSHINTRYLEHAVKTIKKGKFNEIHSILIYRKDKLVFEEYFEGHKYQWNASKYHGEKVQWNSSMKHQIMSCTKSFTSACIGIAVKLGYIKSVEQSIFDYLPEHQHLKTNNRKYITIEHLLTMTSGLAWDEWSTSHGGDFTNDIDHLWLVKDPVTNVLEREWWAAPGEFFTYNGGGMVILGEILNNATGMNAGEFSEKYLFEPLAIESAEWTRYPGGLFDTAGSLRITPRDMLKLGILYLNNGNWNGEQILAPEWIEKSSTVYKNNSGINVPIEDSEKNGYGYTWWVTEFNHAGETINMYRANGWGGQTIMVLPELETVVVFTSGNYTKNSKLFKLVKNYVLPSIQI